MVIFHSFLYVYQRITGVNSATTSDEAPTTWGIFQQVHVTGQRHIAMEKHSIIPIHYTANQKHNPNIFHYQYPSPVVNFASRNLGILHCRFVFR